MTEYVPFSSVLSKIVDNRGKTCPTAAKGIPLIATNCVTNNSLYPTYDTVRYVDDETMRTWFRGHPLPGDLLFVLKGTPGRVALVPDPVDFCVAQDMVALRADPRKIYPKYLFAVLRSDTIQQEIEGLHVGSLIPHFKKGDFDELKIPIVDEKLQEYIGDQYLDFSLKIDLLTRQNSTIEALALTYFRQRFIVESSDDWEVARLGNILESLESGSRPKGGIDPELVDGVPSIGAESINGLGVYDFSKTKYVTKEFFNNMRRGVVKSHDVLIYKDGAYVGRKGMFGNNFPFAEFAVNEHVFILRANEKAGQIFLYFLLQEEELAQLNSNSAQPGLNQQAINAFEIVLPPLELINDFEAFTEPLIDKIFENAKQMRTLQKLRDTLLPKLISGEVRVKQ